VPDADYDGDEQKLQQPVAGVMSNIGFSFRVLSYVT